MAVSGLTLSAYSQADSVGALKLIQSPAVGTLSSLGGVSGYVTSQAGADIDGWLTRQGIDPSSAGSITSTQLPAEAQGKITVNGNKVSLASDAAGVDVGYLVGDAQGNENLTVSVSNMKVASGHDTDTFPVTQSLARTLFNGTTAHGNVTYKYNALITIRFSFDATWSTSGMVITPSNSTYSDVTQQLQDGFNTSDDFPPLTLTDLGSLPTLTKTDTSQVPYSFADYVNGALTPGGSATVNLSNVVSGSWLNDFNLTGASASGALTSLPLSSWFSSNVMSSLSKLPGLTSVKNAQTAADFVAPIISTAAQNGSLNTWAGNQAVASYQAIVDALVSQSDGVIAIDPVSDATKSRIRSNTAAAMTSLVSNGLPAWMANGVSANVQMDATLNPGSVTSITPTGVTATPVAPQVDPQASSLTLSSGTITVDPQAECTGAPVVAPDSVIATARVVGTKGQPMAGVDVTFGVDPQLAVDTPTVNTNSDGVASSVITLKSAAQASSAATSVTARVQEGSGVDLSPAQLTITAMQATVVAPSLTVEPTGATPVLANGQDSYTASVAFLDHCSRPVSGTDVQFSVTGSAKVSADTQPSGADGISSVTITDTKSESVTVTARSGGVVIGSPTPIVFDPAPLSSLFTAAPTSGTATVTADGQSSWTVTVAVTSNGQPAQLPDWQTKLMLLPSSPALTISDFTDNSDGIYTATVTSETAGSYQVTAMYETTNLGTQTVSFVASGPNPGKSTLTVDIPSTSADCGQTIPVVAQATVKDDQGIELPGVDVTFTVGTTTRVVKTGSTGIATLTVNYTMSSADIQDTIHATVDMNGTAVDISGSPAPVAITSQGACYSASLVMTPGSSPVYADGTSTWTGVLTVTSATGESTAGKAGNITVNIYAGSDPTGRVTKGAITDNGDGTYTMKFTSTSAGDYSVQAYYYQYAATPQPISFAALTPSGGTLEPSTQTVIQPCDGSTAEATLTATVRDEQGHTVGGANVIVTVGNNPPQTVTTNPDGTVTIKVTSDSQQPTYTVQVHASLEGSTIELAGSPVTIVYQLADGCGPAPAMSGTLTLQPTQDGSGQVLAVAMVVDGQGAPALNAMVSLTISGNAQFPNGTNSITVGTTADGMAVSMITPTSTDCSNQGYDVSGVILGGDQPIVLAGSPVHVSVQPPAGTCWPTLTIATQPTSGSTVHANGTDTWAITFTVANWDGTPILDGTDSFHGITVLNADGQPTDVVTTSEITNNGDGTYTMLATTTVPGTYTVSGMWGDASSASQPTMTFQSILQGVLLTSGVTPNQLVADGSQASLRVSLADDSGNPLSGQSSALVISADPNLLIGQWTDNRNGTYDATIASRLPGTYSIVVSAVDEGGVVRATTTANVEFTMVLPSLTSSVLELDASTMEYAQVIGDGCGTVTTQTPVTATATVKDGSGAPMAGVEVVFASDDPTILVSSSSQMTNADGVASVQVTVSGIASVVPGEVHISAKVVGDNGLADISGSPATLTLVQTSIGDCCVPGQDCPLNPTPSTSSPAPSTSSPAPSSTSPAPSTSSPAPSESTSPEPGAHLIAYGVLVVNDGEPAGGDPNVVGFAALDVDLDTGDYVMLPDVRVDFTIDSGSASLDSPWCVTDPTGVCVVYVSSDVAGTVVLRAFVNGEEIAEVPGYGYGSPVSMTFAEPVSSSPAPSTSSPASTSPSASVTPTSTPSSPTSAPTSSNPATSSPAPSSSSPAPTTSSPVPSSSSPAPSTSTPAPSTSTPASTSSPAPSSSSPAPSESTSPEPSTHIVVYGVTVVVDGQPAGGDPNLIGFAALNVDLATGDYVMLPDVRVDFTIDSGSATLDSTWCETDATGACAIHVSSDVAGSVVVRAFVDGQEVQAVPGYGYGSPFTVTFAAPATSGPTPTVSTSASPSSSPTSPTSAPSSPTSAPSSPTSAPSTSNPATSAPATSNPATSSPTPTSSSATHGVYYGVSPVIDGQSAGGVPNVVGFAAMDADYLTMATTPVSGVRADFTIDSGSGTLVQSSCQTDATGTCSVPVMSTVAGSVVVRAFVNGQEVTGIPQVGTYASPVTLTFTESSPAPTTSSPAPTSSSPAPTTSSPAPTTSSPAPTSSAPVPPATHGVYYGVSAVADGQPAGGMPNAILFAATDADYLTMTTTPVSGVRADFTIDSGSGTLVQSWCETDATGTCSVPVMSAVVGSVVVRAFVNGQEVTGIPQVGTYASPVTLTFTAPTLVNSPQITVDTSSYTTSGTLIVSGSGWVPGESVHIMILSNTYDLGTVTANSDGTLPDVTFSVPSDFETGVHAITAVGSQSGSVMSTFVLPVPVPQGSVPQGSVSVPQDGSSVRTGGIATMIPDLAWLLIAFASVSVGLLIARKRSRRA